MFWFEAGCLPLPAMNPHATAFVPGAGYASTLGIRENDNRGSPLLTVIDPKKSLHFTFNPFFLKTFPKSQWENIWIPKVQDLCVLIFFVGRFPMNSRSISKPVEAGFVGFHGNVLDNLCPVEPVVDRSRPPHCPEWPQRKRIFFVLLHDWCRSFGVCQWHNFPFRLDVCACWNVTWRQKVACEFVRGSL